MSYLEPRIELTDTVFDIIGKMSEGNPGAVTVMLDLFGQATKIDPDSALNGLGPWLALDTLDIYGSRIWMFYKDVCNEHIGTMIGLMRAVQLGYLTETTLTRAVDGVQPLTADYIEQLIGQVRDFLPAFNRNATE